MKEYNIEYLHKYLTNDTMKELYNLDLYILEDLTHNYVDVDLNIKYLKKYGVTNFDKVIPNGDKFYVFVKNNLLLKGNA